MQYTIIRHTHNPLGKIKPHAPGLLGYRPCVQEHALVQAPANLALWNEIAQIPQKPSVSIPQTEDQERFLRLLHFELHSQNRIWWAYFSDRFELDTCFTTIIRAFPCLTLQNSEACPHGLRVCSAFYASRSTRQQQADASQPASASERSKQLFPLAPFACDHLTSFIKGLGDVVPCTQCQPDVSLPPAGTKASPQE